MAIGIANGLRAREKPAVCAIFAQEWKSVLPWISHAPAVLPAFNYPRDMISMNQIFPAAIFHCADARTLPLHDSRLQAPLLGRFSS
jgi:hypothetical protein